nr:PREDICTED: uncharacterized protein LOC109038699 [Bemisia tabaci]XP_018909413.1 PREDICTED: uncharacterized protein LOC109038699 [Bemisia tabaci]
MSPAEPIKATETTPQRLEDGVQQLKVWLTKQPHLPNVDDEEWLATFLCHCKLSVEKAKHKLDGYFSVRNKYPHILKNRNPIDPEIILAGKACTIAISSRLTTSGARIFHFKANGDPSMFDIDAQAKRVCMIIDATYLERDRHVNYACVFDLRNIHYSYFLKTLTRFPQVIDILLRGYSDRIVSFNGINAPPFIGKVVSTFKKYLPQKIGNRIHIHEEVSQLLECEWVDAEVLAKEFGGQGSSLNEYDEFTKRLLDKHAGWFADQESICSNEELRPKDRNNPGQLQGSFRKLEVD